MSSEDGAAPGVDLFDSGGLADERLNPAFRELRDSPLLAPARSLLRQLQPCSCDREFVARFRGSGFDAALFEIYLEAMFAAAELGVERNAGGAAFLLSRGEVRAAVDTLTVDSHGGAGKASAVSWSAPGDCRSARCVSAGGALLDQLQKRHWARPECDGLPYVLAIEDLAHMQLPRGAPPQAILHFLFGAPAAHELGAVFPEGFFGLEEAENVAGILFCCDATVSKFNRLGQEQQASPGVRILRHGSCLGADEDPSSAAGFVYEVGRQAGRREAWNEGTALVHNPRARHPLPRDWIGAAAELALEKGRVVTHFARGFHPFACTTETVAGKTPAWWFEMRTRVLEKEMAAHPPA